VKQVSRGIDRIAVTFDDENLVANAGLLLVSTLAGRLGIEELVNATVRLAGRIGGALPGRKVLTLVHAIVAGGSHIDHAEVLRSGATQAVLGHRVMAPSTLGTFLRAFTFGHVRQLEAVVGKVLERAWAAGAGPGERRLVVDVDSTICEVAGPDKAGAAFGYTKVLGYHPLVATRSDTGEVLHPRMRKGSANTARGAKRFDGWLFQLGATEPAANTLAAYRRDLEGVARRIAADAEVAVLHLEHLTKEALRVAFASWTTDHAAASVLRGPFVVVAVLRLPGRRGPGGGQPHGRGAQAAACRRRAPCHPRSRRRRSAAGHGGPAQPPRARPWPERDLALVATFCARHPGRRSGGVEHGLARGHPRSTPPAGGGQGGQDPGPRAALSRCWRLAVRLGTGMPAPLDRCPSCSRSSSRPWWPTGPSTAARSCTSTGSTSRPLVATPLGTCRRST
jgi:hypothetical protein